MMKDSNNLEASWFLRGLIEDPSSLVEVLQSAAPLHPYVRRYLADALDPQGSMAAIRLVPRYRQRGWAKKRESILKSIKNPRVAARVRALKETQGGKVDFELVPKAAEEFGLSQTSVYEAMAADPVKRLMQHAERLIGPEWHKATINEICDVEDGRLSIEELKAQLAVRE